MQVCGGKAAPLPRLHSGDRVAYYSPVETFGGADRCQAFTAIGIVRDEDVYEVDLGGGFHPHRRKVTWWAARAARPAPIRPLLEELDLTRGKRNWGYAFRYGLLGASAHDLDVIAAAMQAAPATA